MRKILIVTMALIFILFFSCSSKPVAKTSEIPDWYLNVPTAEDAIYGVGDAVKSSLALAKEAADARARDDIARAVEVKVSNMLRNYMQESGVGEESVALEFVETVSKQVANTTLNGSKVVKRHVAIEGNKHHVYSLVEYNINDLIMNTINEMRKQKALYNEAKAKIAFEELEKEIEKNFKKVMTGQ